MKKSKITMDLHKDKYGQMNYSCLFGKDNFESTFFNIVLC